MSTNRDVRTKVRVIHRYLGFFLAGIMSVYALSGMLLVFRNTDFLKRETQIEKQLEPNLASEQLREALRIRRLQVERTEGNVHYFANGSYNQSTGVAVYTEKELPTILDAMTSFHKAKSGDKFYYFNLFFGGCLLFFALSSFWMFMPSASVFRKGLLFALGGIVLTLLLLFV